MKTLNTEHPFRTVIYLQKSLQGLHNSCEKLLTERRLVSLQILWSETTGRLLKMNTLTGIEAERVSQILRHAIDRLHILSYVPTQWDDDLAEGID